jgi:hypothetical protein
MSGQKNCTLWLILVRKVYEKFIKTKLLWTWMTMEKGKNWWDDNFTYVYCQRTQNLLDEARGANFIDFNDFRPIKTSRAIISEGSRIPPSITHWISRGKIYASYKIMSLLPKHLFVQSYTTISPISTSSGPCFPSSISSKSRRLAHEIFRLRSTKAF